MPRYQATHKDTGQPFEFDWYHEQPPTDADLDEIFTSAQPSGPPKAEEPGFTEKFGRQFLRNVSGIQGFQYAKENPAQAGAAVAGMAAAPFILPAVAGAGMLTIPAVSALEGLAAAGGAAIGQGAKEASQGIDEGSLGRIQDQAVREGLTAAAFPLAGAGGGQVLKATGRGAYRLALRPGLGAASTPEAVEQLIDTGINEGINVSRRGMKKLTGLQSEVGGNVRKLVQSLDATANPQKAFQHLDALRSHYDEIGEVERVAALDRLREVYSSKWGGKQLPVEELHDLKINIRRAIGDSPYEKLTNPAGVEGKMKFTQGLREQIEESASVLPQTADGLNPVAAGNQRLGNLYDLEDAMLNPTVHSGGGTSAALHLMTGHPIAAVASAFGKTAPVLSSVGRRVAKVGELIDPRSYVPVSSMTHEPPPVPVPIKPMSTFDERDFASALDAFIRQSDAAPLKDINPGEAFVDLASGVQRPARQLPASGLESFDPRAMRPRDLDDVGVPVESAEAFTRDQLDPLGIPASREIADSDDLWLRRVADRTPPVISHIGTPGATGAQGLPPRVRPTSLDEFGIPASGELYVPGQLDALGIPATREVTSSEDLWLQQMAAQNPQLQHLPLEEFQRLLRQRATGGTYGVTVPSPSPVSVNVPLTKSSLGSNLTKAEAKAYGYAQKARQQR